MCNTGVPGILGSQVSDLVALELQVPVSHGLVCSVRAVATLNHRDISPALSFLECRCFILKRS